ncbi:nitrite reductase/ring-hydroxylating ferredoxin subunit [Paenibacillus sp. V4I3]|uniref:Rieske (2Fe-2S) protein n=1 Tax=unclassified Paenibacillus TaxID=185978 RepID=UPI0027861929|nr:MULTISPECIES: Rieske 2Fe-2S domain-containing protein [unclassified Paenibacillus]MDQ0877284.1 nitrite reductase/ring-hydroxylating ferredoxin subunit [Paenibacillus sp. V4I3]MDQ0886849.1 nitrite reductase/ring-hydroxylating ferredoxin subunit [Paenibacillus sp. V4I9]
MLDADAVSEGGHAVVTIEGKSISIYRINDEYYALNNYCPHQGVPMCAGLVSGTTLPSDVYEYEYGKKGDHPLSLAWLGIRYSNRQIFIQR